MNPVRLEIPGYRIEKLLAEGGMASVYLACQESLDRPVALKLLRKFDTPAQALRFFNEGRIIASLEHRNIITIFDLGVVGERHYLAMEYLQGGDLRAKIDAGMTPTQVIDLMETLASCLSFVHQKGIIHRDIKPENILFRLDGSVVLTDFGVAKQMQSDNSLTMDGIALGSPYYLSPEQAQCRELDGRADIYSLGIICYELLTGCKPFQGSSPLETIMAHLNSSPPTLPGPLAHFEPLLSRMIAANPDHRFSSAAELGEFIHQMRHAKPDSARPTQSPKSGLAKSWLPQLAAIQDQLTMAVVLVLAAIMLLFVFLWQPSVNLNDQAAAEVEIAVPNQRSQTPAAANATMADRDNRLSLATPVAESLLGSISPATPARQPLPTAMEALQQADAILKQRPFTMPKLQQAYDLYQLTLEKNPLHAGALRGTNNIANRFIEIQSEIQRYLNLADVAIKNNRLTPPQPNNAADYYRLILQLDPNHTQAREGLERLNSLAADIMNSTSTRE